MGSINSHCIDINYCWCYLLVHCCPRMAGHRSPRLQREAERGKEMISCEQCRRLVRIRWVPFRHFSRKSEWKVITITNTLWKINRSDLSLSTKTPFCAPLTRNSTQYKRFQIVVYCQDHFWPGKQMEVTLLGKWLPLPVLCNRMWPWNASHPHLLPQWLVRALEFPGGVRNNYSEWVSVIIATPGTAPAHTVVAAHPLYTRPGNWWPNGTDMESYRCVPPQANAII